MSERISRRKLLSSSVLLAGAASVGLPCPIEAAQTNSRATTRLRYCLNTSTIRGHKIPIDEEIDLVAAAGYDGIEPWIGELQKYVESGGKLSDLRKKLEDNNLTVESAIGFANWIVDDDAKRRAGLETLKRDMDLVRQIGGTRIAAPPAGATDQSDMDLALAAERYAESLRIGDQMQVYPQLELWGFSKTLSRLGELMFVAVESGHEQAALLLDVYHIFKGGSDFAGLKLIDGAAVNVLHMNDYPQIPREKIGDADRVFPGRGVAPIQDILRTLVANGFAGVLSLELFNRSYWKMNPTEVLEAGLNSMKSAVATASLPA